MKITATLGVLIFLLGVLTPRQAKSKRPPVFLNHFYVVLDSATYKDIEQSAFLRGEFAVTEQRTTVRTDMTYTGLYFYGTNTYFEFFDVASDPSNQVGFSGIALGVDREGELQSAGKELSFSFSMDQETITRQYNGKQVPWFYAGKLKDFPLGSSLAVWFMEYLPQFLNEWNPQSGARNQGMSRKQILQRYSAVLKDIPPKPYFDDVIALTVAVNDAHGKKLAELCKLLGYTERNDGDVTVLKGRDIELRLVPQTETSRGIREIKMRVSRKPKDKDEFRFGSKSVLKFHSNGLATWSF
ncbi:MAG TPA: DUF5829 family protein [Pyrinomonadaceae bacterium]